MKKNKSLYIIVALLALFMMGNVQAADVFKTCRYADSNKSILASFSIKTDGSATKVTFNGSYRKNGKQVVLDDFKETITNAKIPMDYAPNTAVISKYKEENKCPKYVYLYRGTVKSAAYIVSEKDKNTAKSKKESVGWKTLITLTYISKDNMSLKKSCKYLKSGDKETYMIVNVDGSGYVIGEQPVSNFIGKPYYYSGSLKGEQILVDSINCSNTVYGTDFKTYVVTKNYVYSKPYDDSGKAIDSVIKWEYDNSLSETEKSKLNEFVNSNNIKKDSSYADPTKTKGVEYCNVYSRKKIELEDAFDNYYSSGDKSKKADYLNKYNQVKNSISEYCSNVIKNGNYDDGCVIPCMGLKETLNGYQEDIVGSKELGNCGMSDDMRDLLSNIFNIVRFAIPALVIVLGLFDFLRAAASGTEDHMKKAQKQLITRLIAAALIFLAPLVISFFLEQFGFIPDGCGIVNL